VAHSPGPFRDGEWARCAGLSGWPRTKTTSRAKDFLIASSHSVDEIARYVTADSLGYLSLEGLYAALGEDRSRYCDACFSGDYLIELPKQKSQAPLRLVGA
jgi:glutamine phosphoribosylpyrophosphate amidotransferase